MTLRLREHLAKLFNAQKKTKTDVFTNDRAMGKLFKEANRVKKVLSANADHTAQVSLHLHLSILSRYIKGIKSHSLQRFVFP